jgi:hypothetical protein
MGEQECRLPPASDRQENQTGLVGRTCQEREQPSFSGRARVHHLKVRSIELEEEEEEEEEEEDQRFGRLRYSRNKTID